MEGVSFTADAASWTAQDGTAVEVDDGALTLTGEQAGGRIVAAPRVRRRSRRRDRGGRRAVEPLAGRSVLATDRWPIRVGPGDRPSPRRRRGGSVRGGHPPALAGPHREDRGAAQLLAPGGAGPRRPRLRLAPVPDRARGAPGDTRAVELRRRPTPRGRGARRAARDPLGRGPAARPAPLRARAPRARPGSARFELSLTTPGAAAVRSWSTTHGAGAVSPAGASTRWIWGAGRGAPSSCRCESPEMAAGPAPVGFWSNPRLRVPDPGERRPNVVLVSADTLRADHLPFYGYRRMTAPHLARLGRGAGGGVPPGGRALAVDPALPRVPPERRGRPPARRLPPGTDPRPDTGSRERFREAGYLTLGTTGGGLLAQRFGFGRGFDVYRSREKTAKSGPGGELAKGVEEVLEWLPQHTDEPFFLFLHTYETHTPLEPREPFFTRLRGRHGTASRPPSRRRAPARPGRQRLPPALPLRMDRSRCPTARSRPRRRRRGSTSATRSWPWICTTPPSPTSTRASAGCWPASRSSAWPTRPSWPSPRTTASPSVRTASSPTPTCRTPI